MRRWLLVLLLLPVVFGQTLKPISVSINVSLDTQGNATVQEAYVLSPSDANEVENISLQFGYSYSAWKRYVEGLYPHVCANEINTVTIVLKTEGNNPLLLMEYRCHPAETIAEDFLYTTYRINRFYFPVISGLMQLPEGYTLTVKLPRNTKILNVVPPAEVEGTTITWRGPLSTAKRFEIVFSIPKTYTVPSVSDYLNMFFSDPRIIFFVAALLIILYAAKDRIKGWIASLISSFTELEER